MRLENLLNAKKEQTMEATLPVKALSVRQPWAWALVNGYKDVENRKWKNSLFRGRVCIHASAGITQSEYSDAAGFMLARGIECPLPHKLKRGTIIGIVDIKDFVSESESPWFFGPKALTIGDSWTIMNGPGRVKGDLGFFDWEKKISNDPMPDPFKWMYDWEHRNMFHKKGG